jgi:hypothetical protein
MSRRNKADLSIYTIRILQQRQETAKYGRIYIYTEYVNILMNSTAKNDGEMKGTRTTIRNLYSFQ